MFGNQTLPLYELGRLQGLLYRRISLIESMKGYMPTWLNSKRKLTDTFIVDETKSQENDFETLRDGLDDIHNDVRDTIKTIDANFELLKLQETAHSSLKEGYEKVLKDFKNDPVSDFTTHFNALLVVFSTDKLKLRGCYLLCQVI